jgi:hypothetical protein
MNSSDVAYVDGIVSSRTFNFVAPTRHNQHSKYLFEVKIQLQPDSSGDAEPSGHIQKLILANRWKVFCLSQDGGQRGFL